MASSKKSGKKDKVRKSKARRKASSAARKIHANSKITHAPKKRQNPKKLASGSTPKKALHQIPSAAASTTNTQNGLTDIMINNIIKSVPEAQVDRNAILLNHVLMNLTKGMRRVSYHSGFAIGVKVSGGYGSIYKDKHAALSDLTDFIEKIGYASASHEIYRDGKISFFIRSNKGQNIGMNLHSFEAGIISGFLTAITGVYSKVSEQRCQNNDSDLCVFTVSNTADYEADLPIEPKGLLERLASSLYSDLSRNDLSNSAKFSESYYYMLNKVVSDKAYLEYMKDSVRYVGGILGDKILSVYGRDDKSYGKCLQSSVKLLNLGKLSIKNSKNYPVELSFDTINSRQELIEISLALISGMSPDRDSTIEAVQEIKGGTYTIRLNKK
ncbi:MAG: hypothetical protein LVQ97_01470 [Candidatus Micrarchaeales archaeon]|jgi:predicted hydrocarbon binding protein|uniref:Uncharacterized protein n=1 Tax=Candidatus Micrarchaeum acidiphilum ARMAN-2 TaxID=425595 RepID=C7DI15_MICA2|nr:MAG: hypothetical protein UNLARM2_0707 [Candidatus Micrarchaeum acidiphilum ARMAN-2]MCW6160837.1 hypothetical protein [Candidatus Micrarchaeales archaeon]